MSTLLNKIKAGALVVDVRTVDEYEEEHYPDAVNIPVDQIQQRTLEFGDKNTSIIVYCASGARSAFAARFLRSVGYVDVTNAGGLNDMPGY
jgi:phage shock protein E